MPLPARHATSKRSKATVSPSQSRQDVVVPGSRVGTLTPLPAPLRHATPILPPPQTQVIGPNTPNRVPPPCDQTVGSSSNTPIPRTQVAPPPVDKAPGTQQQPPQKKVIPKPITAGFMQTVASTSQAKQPGTAPTMKSKPAANSAMAKTNAFLQAVNSDSGWGSPAWTAFSLTDISLPSPTGFGVSFPPDPTSPLHRKPGTFRFGPLVPTTGSEAFTQPSVSQLLTVDGMFFLTDYPMSC